MTIFDKIIFTEPPWLPDELDSQFKERMRRIESRKKQKSQYWREASVESLETFDKLLKAAKRGNIAAQYKVSECYKTGEMGVQINKTEAEKWYSRAIRREKSVLQHTSCKQRL